MFKKLMQSDIAKYVAAAIAMLLVFALTLSLGSSLASYTKTVGSTTINLLITSPEKEVILTSGSNVSSHIKSSFPNMTELYFGNWTDYRTSIASGTSNTTLSFYSTVETMKAAGNAISLSGQTGSFAATAFRNGTKVYVVAPPGRTLYAEPDSAQFCAFGKPDNKNTTITKITFSKNFNTSKVTTFNTFFSGMANLTTISGLENFDTSNVTNMAQMFYYLPKLSSFNVTKFNTAKVENMHGMFIGLDTPTSLDLSSFSNAKLKYLGHFVSGANLVTVYVSTKWTTRTDYPTSTNSSAAEGTTTNLAYHNTQTFAPDSNGRDYVLSNGNCAAAHSISNVKTYDPDNYKDCRYANWEYGYLTLKSGHASQFTLTSAANVRARLRKSSVDAKPNPIPESSTYNAENIYIGSWYTYGPSVLGSTDAKYRANTYFTSTAGDTWSAGGWTNSYMDKSNAGLIKMFWKADTKTLYILSSGNNPIYLPSDCTKIFWLGGELNTQTDFNTTVKHILFDNCTATQVTDAYGMFGNCTALTQITRNRYKVMQQVGSQATDLSYMFSYNRKLWNIQDIELATAANATTMERMFYGFATTADREVTLDLRAMAPSVCTNFYYMFTSCTNLYKIIANNWTIKSGANTTGMFYGVPNLKGQTGYSLGDNTGTGANANNGSTGVFTSPSAAAILANLNLPEGYVSGIDLDMEPDIFSSEVSDEDAATVIAAAERATPKNYEFEGFVLFENSKNGYTEQVNSADLSFSINRYLSLYGGDVYVTPIYSQIPTEEEIELPFQLQKGYISGVELGVEPMTIDAPLEDFGDLFDILNWGEENVPEGYLLDTFMFYTDYMYKEMYIEDAFDFLDEHYADGADTVFKVTPVYMPDPDYEWPEEEEPVTEPTEGDEATTPDEGEGETPSDTPDEPTEGGEDSTPDDGGDAPSDGEESGTTETPDGGESGVETPTDTPEDTPSETPTETPDGEGESGEGESGEGGDSTDGSDSTDTPTVPDASEPDAPAETPDTPTDSGSGDSSSAGDSGAGSSDSGSSDSGASDAGSSDTGSSDSGIGGAVLNLFSDAFRKLFNNVSLTLLGGKTII